MSRRIRNAWNKFKYRKVIMEPYSTLFLCTSIIFLALIYLMNHLFLDLLCTGFYVIALIVIAQHYQRSIVRLNNFLTLQKHPLKPNEFYIYQKVSYNNLCKHSCHELREAYLSEMPEVLTSLNPGRYRIVTQPLFTKELLKEENIKVICKKKAYKKRADKLQQEVFLNRCRNCSIINCPYRASKIEKQFYYLRIKVT